MTTGGPETDLFTVFVELAALRNEVRTESRLVKEALDQFRGVFATLQSSHATLEQELKRARAESAGARAGAPATVAAGVARPARPAGRRAAAARSGPARWLDRWRRRRPAEPDSWREGFGMTLRRLEHILAERRVVRIELMGQRFDPHLGRVIGTTHETGVEAGIVVDEVRAGFLWDDELLRPAEVIVTKAGAEEREAE